MRPFLIAFVLAVGLAGCKKEVIIETTPYKPPHRLNGLHNVQVLLSPFPGNPNIFDERLNVFYLSGKQKIVSIKVEDLPAGLKSSLSVESGYPDFASNFVIKDDGVVAGDYLPRVVLQSEGDTELRYPFQIKVTGNRSCSDYFRNKTYKIYDPSTGLDNPVTSRLLDSLNSTFAFMGILPGGKPLEIRIDCYSRQVVVPPQIINDTTYFGNGYIEFDFAIARNLKFALQSTSPFSTSLTGTYMVVINP